MIRGLPTTIVCACLAGAVGIGLFFIKHEVKEQEARLSELNHEIQNNQEAMHVLKAEWSYLNDPARLRALSEKHLSMKVMGPSQIASLDTLPVGGPAYASARANAAPAIARAEAVVPAPKPAAAPVASTPVASPPVALAKVAPAPAPAPAKTTAKPAAAPVAKPTAVAAAKPAPVVVAGKPAAPALVPGADTTPRLAAAPAPVPLPAQANRTPGAPARSIVVQSPALASTPGLPAEVR